MESARFYREIGVGLFLSAVAVTWPDPPLWLSAILWVGAVVFLSLAALDWVRVRKRGGDRKLSRTQKKRLAESLIDHEVELGKVVLRFGPEGDAEARKYAEEIAEVLESQGWAGTADTTLDHESRLSGLKIWYQPGKGKDPNAARLAKALDAAGVDYDWTPHEPPYSDTMLFVYRRP